MGIQQMLMLVLGIVIVGIAIAVGIYMFYAQEYSTNKRNLNSEVSMYGPYIVKYWETTEMLGGAGGKIANVSLSKIAKNIGFFGPSFSTTSENGELRVTMISAVDSTVTLKGLGRATRKGKHPLVTSVTSLKRNVQHRTTITVDDAAGF